MNIYIKLPHYLLEDVAEILIWKVWFSNSLFRIVVCTLTVKLFLGYPTEPIQWEVNIGSVNGLLLSGNKPLPEPMLTLIYVAIGIFGISWPQWVKSYSMAIRWMTPGYDKVLVLDYGIIHHSSQTEDKLVESSKKINLCMFIYQARTKTWIYNLHVRLWYVYVYMCNTNILLDKSSHSLSDSVGLIANNGFQMDHIDLYS